MSCPWCGAMSPAGQPCGEHVDAMSCGVCGSRGSLSYSTLRGFLCRDHMFDKPENPNLLPDRQKPR